MGKAVSRQFSRNSVFLKSNNQSIRWIQQDQNRFMQVKVGVLIATKAFVGMPLSLPSEDRLAAKGGLAMLFQ